MPAMRASVLIPQTDSVANTITLLHLLRDLINEYEIPTQSCVLSHVTTTLKAIEQEAPVDLVFQSIAGDRGGETSRLGSIWHC